MEECELPIESQ